MTEVKAEKTRVVLIDDSSVIRGLLSRIINAEPDMEVIGTAGDGAAGVAKVEQLKPDAVVLDIEMPRMNGLEALEQIRATNRRLPVIMFSSLTERGATATMEALSRGASDYAQKPTGSQTIADGMDRVRQEIVGKIRALVRRPVRTTQAAPPTRRPASERVPVIDAVVLGCSTGGPAALELVLCSLSHPLPVPMFVVQHMPPMFTTALADRLNRKSVVTVVEAAAGMVAEAGTVYIAPGGMHMTIAGSQLSAVTIATNDNPPENSCRPSVDPLFRSAVSVYRHHLLAVMMTGMGADGLEGTRGIAGLGAPVLAQDQETSVVWGMPGAVVDAGLATEILPVERIGPRMAQLTSLRSISRSGATR